MTINRLRKYITSVLVYSAILLFGAGLIFFSKETSAAAVKGLNLCANVLIPSLFPFFIVSSMAVQTGLASCVGRAFEKPMKLLFNVPGCCAPAFILGLVGGYPVGAKTTIDLYQNNLCTRAEAERLLAFCNNSGPAFILGAVGASVFGTTMAGVLLYVSHVLASIAVGVIFRCYKRKSASTLKTARYAVSTPPLNQAFLSSVSSSFSSVLNICAFVIFFSVAIGLLYLSGVIPAAAKAVAVLTSPFGLDAEYIGNIISGFFEVTTGVYGLAGTSASMSSKLSAAAFMLGWAGISVHCQVLNFIGKSGISTLPYILGKLLHGIFSAAFAFAGTCLLPFDAQVSKVMAGHTASIAGMTAGQSFLLAVLSCAAVWLLFSLFYAIIYCKKTKDRL